KIGKLIRRLQLRVFDRNVGSKANEISKRFENIVTEIAYIPIDIRAEQKPQVIGVEVPADDVIIQAVLKVSAGFAEVEIIFVTQPHAVRFRCGIRSAEIFL